MTIGSTLARPDAWRLRLPRAALVALVVLLGACATTGDGVGEGVDKEAQRIMDRMAAVYAGASTYRDSGESIHFVQTVHGVQTNRIRFATAFARPDAFRFQWVAYEGGRPGRPGLAWGLAGVARVQLPGESAEEQRSIGRSIAAATPSSSGDVNRVPRLLLPNDTSGTSLLRDLEEFRYMGSEIVDGHACFVVSGLHDTAGEQTMWIDEESYLLRKFEYIRLLRGFTVSTLVAYAPELDPPLDATDFAYAMPEVEVLGD